MNTENIFSNEGQLESGESRDAEKEKVDNRENEKIMENTENTPEKNIEANEIQDTTEENLDEATYEPRAHVENNNDYTQAEEIQKSLTELAENEEKGLAEQTEIRGDLDDITSDQGEEDKDEVTPINLPGPVAEDEDDMQLISGPSRDDLPPGSGILEEPHESVEMANPLEDEDTVLGRTPEVRDDLSEATLAGAEDKDEATPINLPGPQPANEDVVLSPDDVKLGEEPEPGPDPFDGVDVALSPDDVKKEDVSDLPIPMPNPGDTGNIASEDDWESPNVNIAKGGNPVDPPPPPDLTGERELSPDDVKLEPAPDFEAMNEGERAVVDVIGKAIADEEYRAALFADTRAATSSHAVTEEDQTGLNEMTEESFNFFAAEVEARLAVAGEQQTLAQVVHSVWRDLNPGGLVYVLTFKIPQYHLV